MIRAIPTVRPIGAAPASRNVRAMRVILHIGAHRCASTTFQHYLRMNAERLGARGIGYWGPRRTRSGMFHGLQPGPRIATGRDAQRRAVGRIRMNLERSAAAGVDTLIVSDENMMGSVRANLRVGDLYSGVGERIARFAMAFDGYPTEVALAVRSLDRYWGSALGYAVTRGYPVPRSAVLARLAGAPRSWRDVVTDAACAAGAARLLVLPFERFSGCPEVQLAALTGIEAPPITHARAWLNATPRLPGLRDLANPAGPAHLPDGDGRWHPFGAQAAAQLRETYADDMMWLTGGADGLARLISEPMTRAGPTRPASDMTRGRNHDSRQNAASERLADTG
jgi:hypothetical protein